MAKQSTKRLGPDIQQITLYLKKDLLERIETYWHNEKLQNRSEAIKSLLEDALNQYEKKSKI
jgi:metal-responsive CopG/Arc/MetJ family transcriptional regulator